MGVCFCFSVFLTCSFQCFGPFDMHPNYLLVIVGGNNIGFVMQSVFLIPFSGRCCSLQTTC